MQGLSGETQLNALFRFSSDAGRTAGLMEPGPFIDVVVHVDRLAWLRCTVCARAYTEDTRQADAQGAGGHADDA